VKIRLSDGAQTCLLSLDWSLAVHISGSENGWAVVSTYAPADPRPDGTWPPFTNEILRLRLDGSEITRLAHHRSRPYNDYNYAPKAALSRDGSRVVYGSNFGLQETGGYPAEYSDAYMIELSGGSPEEVAPVPGEITLGQSGCGTTAPPSGGPLGSALALAPVGLVIVVGRRLARRGHGLAEDSVDAAAQVVGIL
jgi:hypothetical protein